MSFIIFLLVLVAMVVGYIVSVYNSLQTLKTQIKASIQEIGNQLKRQASLIPNLQKTVKGYLEHEKGVYKMLTEARKAAEKAEETGKGQDVQQAIDKMQQVVPQLSLVVEDNPELKADQTVTKFMNELTDTADKLMYARRSVIDLTQAYNQKLITFPSNLVANLFGFVEEKGLATALSGSHLEVSQSELEDVEVDF